MTPQDPHPSDTHDFFIGYQPMPRGLTRFLGFIVSLIVGGFVGVGVILALNPLESGEGGFARGYQNVEGLLVVDPHPVLHILPNADYPNGRAILLVGPGKNGVLPQAQPYDGQIVTVGGFFLLQEDILMLQVSHRRGPVRPVETTADQSTSPLLRSQLSSENVRLYGEIVDGKCYAGAMRPGRGKTHMSCANLCLIGGTPPLFVILAADGSHDYLLLANSQGYALTEQIDDYVSLVVSVEGIIEQRGDLRVFRIDPDTLTIR